MVTVSGNFNPTYPTNPTTNYRCELDICCLTWYKNLGPPFTGMPVCQGCESCQSTTVCKLFQIIVSSYIKRAANPLDKP